ncbi:hypothetical protein VTJ04DRAFT_8792 [Mycothermus thermophilus]|uniref:uncharacterized protein n=1 Tax=Humicola insolens TaxID=85995 RepID=UPI0037420B88
MTSPNQQQKQQGTSPSPRFSFFRFDRCRWTILLLWLLLSVLAAVLLVHSLHLGLHPGISNSHLDLGHNITPYPPIFNETSWSRRPIMDPAAKAREPAVVLRQGTYIGSTILSSRRFPKPIEAFRGIPYAQDTGGANRLRPPQPMPPSNDTFEALRFGKICPSEGMVRRNMSEDCLNANVYRPAGLVDRFGFAKGLEGEKARPRLPVVVYVHGGGFNVGYGAERNMASFVSWAKDPMVAVSFNYRVGPLGFLPAEVTAREGILNLGLRDQQMLFEWVRENIEAFGGDPGNVTLMGLSAGAHSIGHHIIYYATRGDPENAPFQRAVLESGAATARAVFYPTHPRHLVQFREFLDAAGLSAVSETEILDRLRTLPLPTLLTAAKVVWDKYVPSVTWPFQPVIDGPSPHSPSPSSLSSSSASDPLPPPTIPTLPLRSWLSGRHLRIPIITGFNTNEGTSFIPATAQTNSDFRRFFQTLIPSLTQSDLDQLDRLYPDPVTSPTSPYRGGIPKGKGRQWRRLDQAYAHYAYICPVLQTAHYMSEAGVADVYVYRFAATAANGAANHADEAPVVAHDVEVLGRWKGLGEVAGEMHGRFARFVSGVLNKASSAHGGKSTTTKGDGEEGEDDEGVEWPRFVSPFAKDKDGKKRKGTGKMLVFGEGNDERSGGRSKGVPVKVVEMTPLEMEACMFWWERVPLSEGLGRRLLEEDGEKGWRGRL